MTARRMRHLRWEPSGDKGVEHAILGFFAPPREIAAYLLHIGAEIEHALAVQYLYAGYSLGGRNLTAEQAALVQEWRTTVLSIAREEMAHLATVQNLLTSLGSPLTLERQDFPIPTPLFPFQFELQRLTKNVLARYVLAESPGRAALAKHGLEREIDEIWRRVGDCNRNAVHRVGHVYDMIRKLFVPAAQQSDAPMVPSTDIQARSVRFQVRPGEWGLGYNDLLIMTATDRDSVLAAIKAIADQGEGADISGSGSSHFERFLQIYRAFPEEADWQPARNVATNPTTDESAPIERRITHQPARVWAELFNVRYRMLLTFLAHSFCLETPLEGSGRTPRGLVISWTFGEMYNLRSIAEILMMLPLHDDGDVRAGPPFEMPYSLAFPFREPDWWRLHRDLFQSSQGYVALLQATKGAGSAGYLQALSRGDAAALRQIETIVGG